MDLKWLQMGAREYKIRSFFKENTWKAFFKLFPEMDEVSFIGIHGTWKETIPGAQTHDRIEIYLIPDKVTRENTSDEEWKSLLMDMYQFISQSRKEDVPLEVKVETNYLDNYSGWVIREGLSQPVHFWHHRGIQGFSSRVRFNEESERLFYKQSS